MNRLLLALPLIALAACGNEPEVKLENASVSEVAEAVKKEGGDASFVNPGKWQQTASLIEIEAPGMPPESALSMIARRVGQRGLGSPSSPITVSRQLLSPWTFPPFQTADRLSSQTLLPQPSAT
jgi:hypothetical protein